MSFAFALSAARADDPLPEGAIMRLGDMRWRFAENSNELKRYAWLPDSSGLVACGRETIRLFDAKTGRVIRDWKGDRGDCFLSVAVSPDGKTLAATKLSGLVYLWDIATGKKLKVLAPNGGINKEHYVDHIAFSHDGKKLVTGLQGVQLWDVESGKLLRVWRPKFNVWRVGFDGAGKNVFAAVLGGFIWCNVDSDSEPVSAGSLAESVSHINSTGTLAANVAEITGGPGKGKPWSGAAVILCDPITGRKLGKLPENGLALNHSVFFAPSGKQLWTVSHATDNSSFRLSLWEVPNGRRISTCLVRSEFFGPMLPSPDGRTVALLSNQPRLRLLDTRTGKELTPENGHPVPPAAIAFSNDAGTLLSGGSWLNDVAGNLVLWDLRTGAAIKSIRTDHFSVLAIVPSRDGDSFLIGGDAPHRLWSLDAHTGNEQKRFEFDPTLPLVTEEIKLTKRGELLIQTLHFFDETRTFARWDLAKGKQLTETEPHRLPRSGFIGDGERRAAISDMSETDVESNDRSPRIGVYKTWGSQEAIWRRAIAGNTDVSFVVSPNGKIIVTTSTRETSTGSIKRRESSYLQIWDVDTGEERARIERPTSGIAYNGFGKPLFTLDDRIIVVPWGERELLFVSSLSARELGRLSSAIALNPLAFTRDSKRLATGVADGTVLIWDVGKFMFNTKTRHLSQLEIELSWRDLAGEIRPAVQAMARLEESPEQALKMFHERLQPVPPVQASKLQALIADLQAAEFAKRENATHELARYGERAHSALRAAVAAGMPAEARKRIEGLLSEPALVRSPEVRRHLRAIELTAAIATPEAKALLAEWAKGDPAARETRAAKEALERLSP